MTEVGGREQARRLPTTRSWSVWTVAVAVYTVAVMQRTTLSAASLEAAERFDVAASTLGTFVFLQVAVYLVLQLPAGMLVDRYGSRALLTAGGIALAVGQALLAVADSLPAVVAARAAIGLGDAVMLVSVLALLPRWFPDRQVPLLTQVTTIIIQLGQVLTAVPFLALLGSAGWTPAFAAASGASALAVVLTVVVVRNSPVPAVGRAPGPRVSDVRLALREAWGRPGTRLGIVSHMGTQFSATVFALLWGFPYLVSGQELTPSTASALITLMVVSTIACGPAMGVLARRHPLRRSWLVLTVIGAHVLVWTVTLAWPPPAPLWLLVLLVLVLGSGGPGSVVGLDIARTSNPIGALGVTQGLVNSGGFVASLIVLQAVGLMVTARGGPSPEAFRVAWLVQFPIWTLAAVGVVLERKQARRVLAEDGVRPRRVRDVVSARKKTGTPS